MRISIIAHLSLAFTIVAAMPLMAQSERALQVSIRAGVMTPGTFYLEGTRIDTRGREVNINQYSYDYSLDLSQNVGLALDYRLMPRLHVGAFADVTNMNAFDEKALFVDAGGTMKVDVGSMESALRFRPMLGVGFATLGPIYEFQNTHYLTLKLGTEIIHGSYLAEISAYAAPSGGNAIVTTSFGPVAQIRIGRLF